MVVLDGRMCAKSWGLEVAGEGVWIIEKIISMSHTSVIVQGLS